jgi:hypothetical protein
VDHAIELSLLPPLLRRLQFAGALAEAAGQKDCLLNVKRRGSSGIWPKIA